MINTPPRWHGRRQWQLTPVLLPGKSHGWRSLVGCSPWGHKESDTTERLHFHFSLSCIGEGNGNLLQGSCLENPREGGAWWAAVHEVAKSRTRLSDFPFTFHFSLSCIGEGNGNPLQCSCLENPRDGGAWWAAVYGLAQSQTQQKRLSSSSSRWHGGKPALGPNNTTLYLTIREGNGTPLQYSCLENPMDGGAWWAAVHGVAKNWTRLSDFPFTFRFHTLEKEMATHSSVLAWRIPGTGEPGGLPSMGSHRVEHNWSNLAAAAYLTIPHQEILGVLC